MALSEPLHPMPHGPGPHPVTPRRLALLLLGIFLMLVAGIAMPQLFSLPAGTSNDFGPAVFPRVVIGLLLTVGAALVLQAAMARSGSGRRWPPWVVALIVVAGFALNWRAILLLVGSAIGSVDMMFLGIGSPLPQAMTLTFGPSELAAIYVLQMAIGVALACYGRLAGFGMVLLGLLLGLVGIDVGTGQLRFTFNLPSLLDGISAITLAAGLIVVADALLAVVHPTTWLRVTRHAIGLAPGAGIPLAPGIAMRAGGAVLIGLVALVIYWQNYNAFDLIPLAVFAVVGIGLKLCGWNRWLLVAAFPITTLLEESIRRTALLGRGSLAPALERPVTAAILSMVAVIVVAMIVVGIVRFVRTSAEART